MDIRHWLIMCCVIEGEAVMILSTYLRKPVFDNLLPKNGQLWTTASRSQMECCIICQKDSKCISYFYKPSQCTGLPYMMTSYVATNAAPGLIHTDLDVVDALFVALLRGGWRDKRWLFGSIHNDRRNTLIVEVAKHSDTADVILGRPDYSDFGSLSGMAAIYICLRDKDVEPDATLITWTDVQQRQRLVTFLGGSTSLDVLSDHDLASMCD